MWMSHILMKTGRKTSSRAREIENTIWPRFESNIRYSTWFALNQISQRIAARHSSNWTKYRKLIINDYRSVHSACTQTGVKWIESNTHTHTSKWHGQRTYVKYIIFSAFSIYSRCYLIPDISFYHHYFHFHFRFHCHQITIHQKRMPWNHLNLVCALVFQPKSVQ